MAFNGAFLWVTANADDQTTYAGTDRLKRVNNVLCLSFPMKYLAKNGYTVAPNNREEIKAYRDDNTRNLTRVTAAGKKTGIKLKTLGGLHNAEKKEIRDWFLSHETNALQRKINLWYYDTDTEGYGSGSFYRANSEQTAIFTTADDIIWDAFEIELVQY